MLQEMLREANVFDRSMAWVQQDPNEVTARYVHSLLSRVFPGQFPSNSTSACEEAELARKELERLFPSGGGRIGFGTAGLRAAMVPGPLGMNDLTVVQAAQGLARYCLSRQQKREAEAAAGSDESDPSSKKMKHRRPSAVVGYDHRANALLGLSSLQFALLTTLVFLEAGLECILLDGYVATPLVPCCMQQTRSTLGIMITASHNPKEDAGYKVYWRSEEDDDDTGGYACQIRSPLDKDIASCILENLDPWIDYGARLRDRRQSYGDDPCAGLSHPARTKELIDRYFDAIRTSGLVTGQASTRKLGIQAIASSSSPPSPSFCYTAMHGVGHAFALRAFETFGLPPFVSVPSQQEPDPDFSTVPFPNPEERGALDLAKEYAAANGCDVVLANDPDADRLAVAERNSSTGAWTVFTGDQIGTMLGHWLWQQVRIGDATPATAANGGTTKRPPSQVAMLASTVSSRMLAEIARVEGFHFEDTLTGFKWIGSRAAQLRCQGYRSLFCYEEAIGFCCGDVIFDKDGLSAMGVLCELAMDVYSRGLTLSRHLQSLYDKYGEFVSNNGYYFVPDVSVVSMLLDQATNHGRFDKLQSVGPYKVNRIRYLGEPGYDSSTPDRLPTLPTSRSSPLLTLWFENGCVAQMRGSGTEPKFKYYIELRGKPGVPRAQVEEDLNAMSSLVLCELLRPDENGLRKP
jgi:phosphomannomutase